MRRRTIEIFLAACGALTVWLAVPPHHRAEPSHQTSEVKRVANALDRHLFETIIPLQEVTDFVWSHCPPMPEVRSVAEWERYAKRARSRGTRPGRLSWRGSPLARRAHAARLGRDDCGGPGYTIKKLRYEAVPGLWIPALLYEPTVFKEQKVPVSLAVNGHEPLGKFVDYKQIRCINQAKRGMIVLNMEYLGMGELEDPRLRSRTGMNQIDLCGTSGVATFYLAMSRGLDILLAHEHADPTRVAVQGLSGGGWQTITISAFDTRVTLTNPVAGYSALHTRACVTGPTWATRSKIRSIWRRSSTTRR